MAKLSELFEEKAKATLQIGGANVEIQWYVLWRRRFGEDEWTELIAKPGREHLKMLIPRLLVSWGITDDNGTMIPITAEAIEEYNIPTDVLAAIETRVVPADLAGKVTTSRTLPAT